MWHDALASEMGAANIAEFLQSEVATVSASKDALGIIKKVRGASAYSRVKCRLWWVGLVRQV